MVVTLMIVPIESAWTEENVSGNSKIPHDLEQRVRRASFTFCAADDT